MLVEALARRAAPMGERRGEEIAAGTLTSPTVSLIQALGGGKTTSGATVNESTAEGIPAWYASVRVISETVGQLPFKLYRKVRGGKFPDERHPLYTVLHDFANPEMIAYVYREMQTRFLATWGNSYAEIERDGDGRVKALWPLAPNRMRVDRDEQNRKRFRYTAANGQGFEWIWNPRRPPIQHLMINCENGLTGRSPIRVLLDSLGLTKAAQEYGERFFGNNQTPAGILYSKTRLSPQAKQHLREGWQKVHGGLSNQQRLAILEEDLKFERVGLPNVEAQFLETRSLQIEETARILRVPLFMIQHMTKSTAWGSGIEQMGLGFVNFTLMNWLVQWVQATRRDCLSDRGFETHDAGFVVNSLVRGSFAERMAGYKIQAEIGMASPNDLLRREDENVRDDDFGDQYLVPVANYVPASVMAKALTDGKLPSVVDAGQLSEE